MAEELTFTDKDKRRAFSALEGALFNKEAFCSDQMRPIADASHDDSYPVRLSAGRILHRAINSNDSLQTLDWATLDEVANLAPEAGPMQDVACECWMYSPQKRWMKFPQVGADADDQGGMPP